MHQGLHAEVFVIGYQHHAGEPGKIQAAVKDPVIIQLLLSVDNLKHLLPPQGRITPPQLIINKLGGTPGKVSQGNRDSSGAGGHGFGGFSQLPGAFLADKPKGRVTKDSIFVKLEKIRKGTDLKTIQLLNDNPGDEEGHVEWLDGVLEFPHGFEVSQEDVGVQHKEGLKRCWNREHRGPYRLHHSLPDSGEEPGVQSR